MPTVWFIGDQTGKVAPLRAKLGAGRVVTVTGWYRDEGECIDYFAECLVADPKAMAGLSVQHEEVELPTAEEPAPKRGRRSGIRNPEPEPPPAAVDDQGSLFG